MRRSSLEKTKFWSERLARFRQGNQTVAAFCQSESLSQPSFYYWKRKLALVDLPRVDRTLVSTGSFQAVELRSVIQTTTTIRLGENIEIQLGSDLPTVATVIDRLVKHVTDSEEIL